MLIAAPSRWRCRLGVLVIIIGGAQRLIIGYDQRHCARNTLRCGTLMRHFLPLATAPSVLPCGVPTRTAVTLLIALPRTP
jgi:hypothetical protein